MERVTIVGRGALGILYGDRLTQALGPDRVRFLADGARLARYRESGTWCNGHRCDFRFSDGSDGPAELLIFAVKATALEEAIELARPCVDDGTVILSVLNGVTSEELLSQAFGPEKVLYTVVQGMDAVREGDRLTCTSPGEIFLGVPEEDWFDRGERLAAAADLLRRTGLPVTVEPDIVHRLWSKFMLNVGVNQVCMAYEVPYGAVQVPGALRETMIAAMNEARKVSACQGVLVTQRDLAHALELIDGLAPQAMPSMRQDGLAHRRTEVDLFAGTVVDLAQCYGMSVPVNTALLERIREMEAAW